MTAKFLNTTDKVYHCVQCGSDNVKIIRQDTENPRCRCGQCGMVFNGADSLAAEQAGQIRASSPESLADAAEPEVEVALDGQKVSAPHPVRAPGTITADGKLPRSPSFVFLSKDRSKFEFCTKKTLRRTTMKWELTGPYDVYELSAKKLDIQLDLS